MGVDVMACLGVTADRRGRPGGMLKAPGSAFSGRWAVRSEPALSDCVDRRAVALRGCARRRAHRTCGLRRAMGPVQQLAGGRDGWDRPPRQGWSVHDLQGSGSRTGGAGDALLAILGRPSEVPLGPMTSASVAESGVSWAGSRGRGEGFPGPRTVCWPDRNAARGVAPASDDEAHPGDHAGPSWGLRHAVWAGAGTARCPAASNVRLRRDGRPPSLDGCGDVSLIGGASRRTIPAAGLVSRETVAWREAARARLHADRSGSWWPLRCPGEGCSTSVGWCAPEGVIPTPWWGNRRCPRPVGARPALASPGGWGLRTPPRVGDAQVSGVGMEAANERLVLDYFGLSSPGIVGGIRPVLTEGVPTWRLVL